MTETIVENSQPSEGCASRSVGQLFMDYRRYVAKIGSGILRSQSEVDDLVQDVFLATHRDLHGLRDVSSTKAWLATVTVRLALRSLRHRSLHRRISQIEPYALSLMGSVAMPSDLRSDLAGTTERLGRLPRRLRTAWLLKHVDGESLPTIAERCECSPSTAQRRINSATRRMNAA
jgi:RNA polymerase sigma-70 factor, ECF subfamily